MSNFREIPKFKSEKEEEIFWKNNDSSEYLDWSKAEKVKFTNLKSSTKAVKTELKG